MISFRRLSNKKRGVLIGFILGIFWSVTGSTLFLICNHNTGSPTTIGICASANIKNLFGLPFMYASSLLTATIFPPLRVIISSIFLISFSSFAGALVGSVASRYSLHGGIIGVSIPLILFSIRLFSPNFFKDIVTILFGPYSIQGDYVFFFLFYAFIGLIAGIVIGGISGKYKQ